MSVEPQPIDFAIRLADEGVPLRAIARAIKIPSSDLREQLVDAQSTGRLVELPRDDWPPGCPRDQRALQISRMLRERRERFSLSVQQLFCLTPGESRALVKLVEHDFVSRETIHLALSGTSYPLSDIKIVDVRIHDMRKRLKKFNIMIITLRSYGFQLPLPHRNRVLEMLLPLAA